ncbi:MAG: hypothetical protein JXA46_02125 [Dehalococcoidales bacterium]|nr:hypothetical protein [Dehalococcoidales bacterium]
MDNPVLYLLPVILLLLLYVFIFLRRGEIRRAKTNFRSQDWMTFFTLILGSVVLAKTIGALGIKLPVSWAAIVMALFLLYVVIVIIYKFKAGKPILRQSMGDERMDAVNARSTRNALFVTYLIFFLHLVITDNIVPDAVWLVAILAGGLVMLVGSIFFYYYKKS